MKRLKLSQAEIDKLVVVECMVVPPTVQGRGYNDVIFQIKVEGKMIWQYVLWQGVLARCLCKEHKMKYPTYMDAKISDGWLSFATFLAWVNKEVGYSGKVDDFNLDKDIIIKGNKVYSPETCSFVPQAINKLLIDCGSKRGQWPIGVYLHKGAFTAFVRDGNKQRYLGRHTTPEEAFLAYKVAKEAQIKAVANQYKHVLKPAVYESLMNWEIEP